MENLTQELLRAASVIASLPDAEDDEVRGALVQAGFPALQAYRLLAWIPEAFARPVLKRFGIDNVAPTFVLLRADGTEEERPLSEEPYYQEGLALIDEAISNEFSGPLAHEIYKGCVSRSSTLATLSQAFHEGKTEEDLAGGTFGPYILPAAPAEYLAGERKGWRSWLKRR